MTLTRLEKMAFGGLFLLLGLGCVAFGIQMIALRHHNFQISAQIMQVAALTPRNRLEKVDDGIDVEHEHSNKLNIHYATLNQLVAIPKIGKVLAERIINFVKDRKEIRSLNELSEIKGISRKTVQHLSQYLTHTGGVTDASQRSNKLKINMATQKELEALPGIGKKLAEDILDFRNKNGGIFSLEDMMDIPGITATRLTKIRDLIEFR